MPKKTFAKIAHPLRIKSLSNWGVELSLIKLRILETSSKHYANNKSSDSPIKVRWPAAQDGHTFALPARTFLQSVTVPLVPQVEESASPSLEYRLDL